MSPDIRNTPLDWRASSPQKQTLLASLLGFGYAFLDNRLMKYLQKHTEYYLVPAFLGAVLGLWYLVLKLTDFPPFILPAPPAVAKKFVKVIDNGELWKHIGVTFQEAGLGFIASMIMASILGYILAKSKFLERLVSPYLVAGQTVPLIALAPLLAVWLGYGMEAKIFIALVIVFFPMLVNVIIGIRLVSDDQRELMRSYSTSPLQVFFLLELPSALPVLLGALKIGITVAISGAMVGEYVSAHEGLGFMILHAKQKFDTAQVFVTIITLVILNVSLYGIVTFIDNVLLSGRKRGTSI